MGRGLCACSSVSHPSEMLRDAGPAQLENTQAKVHTSPTDLGSGPRSRETPQALAVKSSPCPVFLLPGNDGSILALPVIPYGADVIPHCLLHLHISLEDLVYTQPQRVLWVLGVVLTQAWSAAPLL